MKLEGSITLHDCESLRPPAMTILLPTVNAEPNQRGCESLFCMNFAVGMSKMSMLGVVFPPMKNAWLPTLAAVKYILGSLISSVRIEVTSLMSNMSTVFNVPNGPEPPAKKTRLPTAVAARYIRVDDK
eukprot:TRINITY_DN8037_c0_g1_i1.p2 TRINITY_DN8037_c0_g1~~TRINITY_DN8037_c0_g1_i1.p2  ORF type:complete len:128 (-),score=0.71 TRINITY_DN8037_c0_g1_i1:699-1082(-)